MILMQTLGPELREVCYRLVKKISSYYNNIVSFLLQCCPRTMQHAGHKATCDVLKDCLYYHAML